MNSMQQDIWLILPQIIVLIAGAAVLILEMLRQPKAGLWLLGVGMLSAAVLSVTRLDLETTAFSQTFRVDPLSHWSVILLCPSTLLIALLARHELRGTPREGTVYSLMAFSTLASLLLAGSGDVMFIVLGILMSSLSGFALAAYPKTVKATEGAMKYFIFASVTGAIMIFGLTYWVGATGTTLLAGLSGSSVSFVPAVAGFVGLIVGIGYAASLFPFHFWTPDAFEGAPVSVAALLSVVPKVGAIFALAQVVRSLPVALLDGPLAVALLAAFSMTYGNVVALWQQNVVRLLAYSTVAQAGYFLLGIVTISHSRLSVSALVIFGAAYALMNIGAFAVVLQQGTSLADFQGLGKVRPWQGVAMALFLFSLVGIPPLAGFAGKFLLFGAAIEGGYGWLAVVAILNSAISLGVYLRIIVPMYYQTSTISPARSRMVAFVWGFCLLLTVLVGVGVQVFL